MAIIQPFKKQCPLMFFKGAMLQDDLGLLRSQGRNTQSAMRLGFAGEARIRKSVVKAYVKLVAGRPGPGRCRDSGCGGVNGAHAGN